MHPCDALDRIVAFFIDLVLAYISIVAELHQLRVIPDLVALIIVELYGGSPILRYTILAIDWMSSSCGGLPK